MRPLRGWRVPLRVARRDALRSRGRSALIVAMIAIPVLGLGGVDVLFRTITVDNHERVALEIGSTADAWVRLVSPDGSAIEQSVDANESSSPPPAGVAASAPNPSSQAAPSTPLPLASLLPAGSQVARVDDTSASASQATGNDTIVDVVVADARNPLVAGRYPFTGAAPRAIDEVLASPGLLSWLHLHVGSTVELVSGSSDETVTNKYQIVGTLHDPDTAPGYRGVLALPGAVSQSQGAVVTGKPVAGSDLGATWLIRSPGGVPWSEVTSLNAKGYLVFSRQVIAHPPASSEVPFDRELRGHTPLSVQTLFGILVGILVIGLACLEVCLLAGAAFAVGVRRQTRTLGLLSASGADDRGVRRVVLAQGVVLGAVAAVLGVPLAILLARIGLPLLENHDPYHVYGPFDVRPWELLGIGAVAVVAGLTAAAIPARTASRLDPVRALAGRRGQASSPKRWPLIGVGLAGIGTLLSLAGAARVISLYRHATNSSSSVYGAATTLLVGAVLVQLGLIVATPAIIGAAGRLARFLPLGPRLAVRDAARNRGRTAPAVGAVLAAVAAASALTLYVASQNDHDRRHYQPTLLSGQGQISLRTFGASGQEKTLQESPVRQAVLQSLPVKSLTVLRTLSCTADHCLSPTFLTPPANECPAQQLADPQAAQAELRRLADDWRCQQGQDGYASRYGTPVGDGTTVTTVSGIRSAAADAVLRAGGVVVFNRAQVLDGKAQIQIYAADGSDKTYTLPALYLPTSGLRTTDAIWSPPAASRVGLTVADDSLLMTFTHPPTTAERKAADAALKPLGVPYDVYVETGYHSNYGPGLLALVAGAALVTLLATGVATGLSQADARPDHATLSAVGASPGVRRTLAGAQSWSLALLGTLLGVIAGFVPGVALLWARPDFNVIVPWASLALTVFVVPLIAGAGALVLTRSRLPLDRRLT
jgi:putative ABC transport system permease protein